jgi:hypothetical protein
MTRRHRSTWAVDEHRDPLNLCLVSTMTTTIRKRRLD